MYFTRSRCRTTANSEDGTICDNGLRLKGVYYSIVTRSSALNFGRGLRPAFDYIDISQNSWLNREYSNGKYKNWSNLVTKITRNHVEQCSYRKVYWKLRSKSFKRYIYVICISFVYHSNVIRMSIVCHSYVIHMSLVCHSYVSYDICMSFVSHSYILVCDPYITRMYLYVLVCHPYVTRIYSYVIRMSLVCTHMSSVCHSYVLVYQPYFTSMHSYFIRMSLIFGFTMNRYLENETFFVQIKKFINYARANILQNIVL